MDLGQWISVVSALVVAVTSILALFPAEPEPTIILKPPEPHIIYIQARAVFTDSGQDYVLDTDKRIHKRNDSVVVYYHKRDLIEKVHSSKRPEGSRIDVPSYAQPS